MLLLRTFLSMKKLLYEFFHIKENNTTITREIIGGVTTFMTMAYIIFVNPAILSKAGMNYSAVLVATALSASFGSILMGLLANYPFALAPGMGLNAYFTYTIVLQLGFTWQVALGAVFISGLLFFLLTLLRIRQLLIDGIPDSLKNAISAGIGLFIALIGLEQGGIIVHNDHTLIEMGNLSNIGTVLCITGIILIAILRAKDIFGSMLIGIIVIWLTSIILGDTSFNGFFRMPPPISPVFFKLDLKGAIEVGFYSIVFVILFVDLFDATGTFIGVAKQGGFMVNGELPRMTRALCVDAITAMFGAFVGTSTTTVYVESTTGIIAGGRTGLTAIVVGLLFLLSLFISPLASSIPQYAIAPALVIVGSYMMQSIIDIDWRDFTESFPAFLLIIFMPFTFSIANGIVIGVILYPLMKLFTGRVKETSVLLWVLAFIFIIRFIFMGVYYGNSY
jgi:AGZA family xanthine/uracil permease-like MFS transporter